MSIVAHRTADSGGQDIFYREAGPQDGPALLRLHGFPTSSHMYRNLIPSLADTYRVIAPDLPGFGFSDAPDRADFSYTFENLTRAIDRFTERIGLRRYAVFVFDYGAPIGLRLAVHHPERITAIISQNGNAYVEGLSDGWNPIRTYWEEPTTESREALRGFLPPGAEAIRRDIPDAEIRFFDAGHFALETHPVEITAVVRDFLARTVTFKAAA